MRLFYFLTLSCCFIAYSFAQAPQWANYINDGYIDCIAFEDDFVWIGSQGGLTKINQITGEKQSFLPSNSGMKGFGVRSLLIGGNGVKWIGGENGGLMKFDGTNWESFTYINTGDTLTTISKLKLAPNGDLWIVSIANSLCYGCPNVFRYNGAGFEKMDSYFGVGNPNNGSGPIQDFDFAPNGDIWVAASDYQQGTSINSVQQFSGSDVVDIFSATDIGLLFHENLSKILVGKDGVVYCLTSQYGTQDGNKVRIRKLEGGNWALLPIQGEEVVDGYPYQFFKSDDDEIWLQYLDENNNAYFKSFDGVNWRGWKETDLIGLPAGYNPPQLLNVDENGHWWLFHYTLAGIHTPKVFEYDNVSFKEYDTEIFPMMSNLVNAVEFDCDGSKWFAGRGLNKFDGSDWTEYDGGDIGASINAWSMSFDSEQCVLWIPSYGVLDEYGIVSYDGNVFKKYNSGGGGAFKVKIAEDGTVWVATVKNGIGRFDGANWVWYNESNSPLDNWVYDIALDTLGGIWARTFGKGLMHWDGNNWQIFDESNSPISNYGASFIFIDHDGIVWTSNQNGDLLRYDGLVWETTLLPPTLFVQNFIEEDTGKYWMSVTGGILFWDGSTFEKYNLINSKLGSNSVRDIKIDEHGNKWFVHTYGVSVFNENGITNLPINPPNTTTGTTQVDDMTARPLIYPNPNNGSFWLETTGDGPWAATVSDLSGRVVRRLNAHAQKLGVDGLAPGFYIVTIKQAGHVFNEKIMVAQ